MMFTYIVHNPNRNFEMIDCIVGLPNMLALTIHFGSLRHDQHVYVYTIPTLIIDTTVIHHCTLVSHAYLIKEMGL